MIAKETNVDKSKDNKKVTADQQINDSTDIDKVSNTSEFPNKSVQLKSGDTKLEEKLVGTDYDKNVVDNIKDSKEGRADDSSIDVITSKELGQKRSIEDTDEPSKKSKRKFLNETPKKDSPFKSVEVTPTETSPDEITTEKSSQKDNNKENIIDQSVSKPINNPQSKSTVLTESVDVAIAEMDVSMSKACDDVITGTNDVIQMMKKELAARKESKKDELLVEAKHIPRQKPKSGKFWKAERSAFRSLKKDKGQRSTFDERLKMKEEKLKNKELAVMLLEKKNLKKAEMRKKIEDNKARKTENEKN